MFVGRTSEIAELRSSILDHRATFIVITGRRRIGKSSLVHQLAKDFENFYEFSALPPEAGVGQKEQKVEFANQLSEIFGLPQFIPQDWSQLFSTLARQLPDRKNLVFFDEISWMGKGDRSFLSKLKRAWDLHFKSNNRLTLILCGSVSSWIEENLLSSTGFVGRISFHLRLQELPLRDCNEFWGSKNDRIATYEKLKILSITGGVPRYLEEIDPSKSAEDNIERLCFKPGSLLYTEFDRLFSDLFSKKAKNLERIVSQLVDGRRTYEELAQSTEVATGGSFSQNLSLLRSSGFISEDSTFHIANGGDSSLSKYRLSDNYLRFYLKYLLPLRIRIEKSSFRFKSLANLDNWESILGLQFENLILHNRESVLSQLGIDLSVVTNDAPYFQRKTSKQKGVQVDYLVRDKFNTVYLCEIKISKSVIGTSVINEVADKLERLNAPRNFSIRPVLIYSGLLSKDLENSDFFDKFLDVEELF